jgi:hypothetical protein
MPSAHATNSSNVSAPVWYTCPTSASSTPISMAATNSAARPATASRPRTQAIAMAATSAPSTSANFA